MVFEAHSMSFPCTELLLFNYAKVNTVFHSMAPLNKTHYPSKQLTETPLINNVTAQILTVSNLNVFEGHFRARIADQHLSIKSEHDVHFNEVYHAPHHITRLPLTAKWLITNVPSLSLQEEQRRVIQHLLQLSKIVCQQLVKCICCIVCNTHKMYWSN